MPVIGFSWQLDAVRRARVQQAGLIPAAAETSSWTTPEPSVHVSRADAEMPLPATAGEAPARDGPQPSPKAAQSFIWADLAAPKNETRRATLGEHLPASALPMPLAHPARWPVGDRKGAKPPALVEREPQATPSVTNILAVANGLRRFVEAELNNVRQVVAGMAKQSSQPASGPTGARSGDAVRQILGRMRLLIQEERFRSGKLH
jgi:hypothetical protein